MTGDQWLDEKRLAEIMADPDQKARYDTAVNFLSDIKARPSDFRDVLSGIDFRKDVSLVEIKPDTILQRSENPNPDQPGRPQGCFFTDPGTNQEKLGLVDIAVDHKPESIKWDLFQTNDSVSALKSTAADFSVPTDNEFNKAGLLYEGGGTQYYVGYADLDKIERVAFDRDTDNSFDANGLSEIESDISTEMTESIADFEISPDFVPNPIEEMLAEDNDIIVTDSREMSESIADFEISPDFVPNPIEEMLAGNDEQGQAEENSQAQQREQEDQQRQQEMSRPR